MKRIIICLGVLLICAGFAPAQKLQTVKGYLCSVEEGDGASLSLRVGNQVRDFFVANDEPKVKYTNFKNVNFQNALRSEVVITYVVKKKSEQFDNIVRSFTVTGRINKRMKLCNQ